MYNMKVMDLYRYWRNQMNGPCTVDLKFDFKNTKNAINLIQLQL